MNMFVIEIKRKHYIYGKKSFQQFKILVLKKLLNIDEPVFFQTKESIRIDVGYISSTRELH
jgi:hypothetical protein